MKRDHAHAGILKVTDHAKRTAVEMAHTSTVYGERDGAYFLFDSAVPFDLNTRQTESFYKCVIGTSGSRRGAGRAL